MIGVVQIEGRSTYNLLMPKRTNPFQQLVHLIEHQLAPHDATVTESKEFLDRETGEKREVDIVIERKSGIHPFVIGIECRDHKRPADSTWIERIASKHQDIGINKTIAVSRSGFYNPALIKAKKWKIDTLTLSEAKESDWVTYTSRLRRLETMSIETPVAQCNEIRVQVLPPSSPPYPPPPVFGSEESMIIYDSADNSVGNVKQVVDSVIRTDPNFRAHIEEKATYNADVAFDFNIRALDELYYVFDTSGTKHRLAQIVLRGTCRLETSTLPLERANYETASVLHGSAEHMGQEVQVSWTEQDDGSLMFGVRFGAPKTPEPSKPSSQNRIRQGPPHLG
jgi:hypothetical protein